MNQHDLKSRSDYSVAVLVFAAIGAILFTVTAGVFVNTTTKRLIAASDWIEHTQEVLLSLQGASQYLERIEYRSRLFAATQDTAQLAEARVNAVNLETAALHVKTLVADNPSQQKNVQALMACTAAISEALGTVSAAHQDLPDLGFITCRKNVSVMREQERNLLKDRTDESKIRSAASLSTEFLFIGLSLTIMVALFGFLLRNALRNRRQERETRNVNAQLQNTVQELRNHAEEDHLLAQARDELQLCVAIEDVYTSASLFFGRLLPSSAGALCITDDSRHAVVQVSSWQLAGAKPGLPVVFAPDSCCGLRAGQLRWRRERISELHCAHFEGDKPSSYLCVPLTAQGDTLGMVYIECPSPRCEQEIEARMPALRQLIQLTAMAVASLNLRLLLENRSIRDALTGLFNRHFMEIALERELLRAARHQSLLSVFMLDVDHFKKYNDTFGHLAADEVLRKIADVFRTLVRAEDVICRYGGEEFVIILPEISAHTAYERAEAIRLAVSKLSDEAMQGTVTISIGIAMYPEDGREAIQLIQVADRALYEAKRTGRNRVVLISPGTLPEPLSAPTTAVAGDTLRP